MSDEEHNVHILVDAAEAPEGGLSRVVRELRERGLSSDQIAKILISAAGKLREADNAPPAAISPDQLNASNDE
jgi:hypothetical protein